MAMLMELEIGGMDHEGERGLAGDKCFDNLYWVCIPTQSVGTREADRSIRLLLSYIQLQTPSELFEVDGYGDQSEVDHSHEVDLSLVVSGQCFHLFSFIRG